MSDQQGSGKWEVGSQNAGFTLTEAMVVVIILGVLMAVGIPSYTRTVERNYRQQAQDILMSIYHGERSYYHTQGSYHGPLSRCAAGDTACMANWRKVQMDDPNLGEARPVDFTVAAVGTTFTATAKRMRGPCTDQTLTITQTGPPVGGGWLTCAP